MEAKYGLYVACFDHRGLSDYIEIATGDYKSLNDIKQNLEYLLKVVSFKKDFLTHAETGHSITLPNAFRVTGYGLLFSVEPIL